MNETATPPSAHTPKKLGIDLKAERNKTFGIDPNQKRISAIAVDLISGDPNQPRKRFDKAALTELADSIKTVGLISPIAVRIDPDDRDRYIVVAGERRFQAHKLAEIQSINAIIVEDNIEQIQLVENIQREDLSPLEEANAYKRYMEKFKLTQEQLAEHVGKKRTSIVEILSIIKLPESILMRLDEYPHVRKSQLIEMAKEKDTVKLEKLWFYAKQGEGALTVKDAKAISRGEKKVSDLSPTEKAIKSLASVAKKFEKLEILNDDQVKDAKNALKGINKVLKEKAQ